MPSSTTHYENIQFSRFVAEIAHQGDFHHIQALENIINNLGENLGNIESIKVMRDKDGSIGHWYLFTTTHCYQNYLEDIIWCPRNPDDIVSFD